MLNLTYVHRQTTQQIYIHQYSLYNNAINSINKLQYNVRLFSVNHYGVFGANNPGPLRFLLYFQDHTMLVAENHNTMSAITMMFLLIVQLWMVSFMPFPLFIKSKSFFAFLTWIFQLQ